MSEYRKRTVGILVFDDVEVLDFCGPFEVFSSARTPGDVSDESRLFDVKIIAEERRVVTCRGGMLVLPHETTVSGPPLDILVVPGGRGTRRERFNDRLLDWIAEQAHHTELTTSVCTGAFLLAQRGLLDGLRATTHWGSIQRMREQYPQVRVIEGVRVVDEGHVITSAGVSAGIDMSLHVIARLHGESIASQTARGMEYEWDLSRNMEGS